MTQQQILDAQRIELERLEAEANAYIQPRELPTFEKGMSTAVKAKLLSMDMLQWRDSHGKDRPVIYYASSFYIFNGQRYEPVSTSRLVETLYEVYAKDVAQVMPLTSASFIEQHLIPELKLTQEVRYGNWDGFKLESNAVVFNDKLVTLRGNEFKSSRATANNTCMMGVPFDFEELKGYDYKQSEFYEKVIQRMFNGRMNQATYLGMHVCQMYFDSDTQSQRMPILAGKGASGKSVLTNALLHHSKVSDCYASVPDFSQLIGKDSRFNRYPLVTARIMDVQDTTLGRFNNWDALKPIINKDELLVEQKFQNATSHPITASMMANTNDPTVRETFENDGGLARRFALLEFNDVIPTEQRDDMLGNRLKSDEEQKAVWAFMVQSFIELRDKFGSPTKAVPAECKIETANVATSDNTAAKILRIKGFRAEAGEGFEHKHVVTLTTVRKWVRTTHDVDGNSYADDDFIKQSEVDRFDKKTCKRQLDSLNVQLFRDSNRNDKCIVYSDTPQK